MMGITKIPVTRISFPDNQLKVTVLGYHCMDPVTGRRWFVLSRSLLSSSGATAAGGSGTRRRWWWPWSRKG